MIEMLMGSESGGIEFVGSQSWGYDGGTSIISPIIDNLTGGVGGGLQSGDMIIAVIASGQTGDAEIPSGYTNINDSLGIDTYSTHIRLSYRFYTTYESQINVNGGSGDVDAPLLVTAYVFRGVDTTTPIDTSSTSNSPNTHLPTPASILPSSGKIAVFAGSGITFFDEPFFSSSDLSNFTVKDFMDSGSKICIGMGVGMVEVTGGSISPTQFTSTATDNTSYSCASVSVVLNQA